MKDLHILNVVFAKNIIERGTRILGAVALGVILTAVAVFGLLILPAGRMRADGPDEANVVVQYEEDDSSSVIVRQIDFVGPISGAEALALTGLDVITHDSGFGITVCSIEGVGCPASDCFCGCPPPYAPCVYWSQWVWDSDHWSSGPGASDSVVNNGSVEGWVWGTGAGSPPAAPPFVAASNGLEWLQSRQSAENGSYGGDVGSSVETMLAIGANDLDADQWRTSPISPSLFDYLQTGDSVASYAATNAGRAGKLAVALAGVGQDPQSFNGLNLVISLTNYYSATTGAFDEADINQAWAMLGWRAASQTVPISATHYLVAKATATGGWEWVPGWGSDTNSTALAIQALVAGGECITSPNIANGLVYLKSAQNDDGGFTYDPQSAWGTDSDTNSTAWVVQTLLALGEDPTSTKWMVNSSTPISYLLSMQLADGSFEWQTGFGSNLLATQQVIPALLGRPFPLNVNPPDQSQCFVSPPSQAVSENQYWLPIIIKNSAEN
jgi:hypothetical protein